MPQELNILNRKAEYEFLILEKFSAGIMLTGTEIKSIRQGKVNMSDAYCTFTGKELYVLNLHIADYNRSSFYKHDTKRPRKLLLKKQEIKKIHTKVKEKGFTIVPVRMFVSDTGYAKLDIALAKGKKTYDKRESIKDKDVKREIDRGE